MTTEEILLSRAVDRAASAEDWHKLQDLSARDSAVWQRLAETLRAETARALAVQNVLGTLPEESTTLPRPRSVARRRWLQGLATAVLVLVTWVVARGTVDDPQTPIQGDSRERSASDLLREYVRRTTETGQHVRELPLATLATRPVEGGGGLEVIYVRRLLERVRVDRAVRLGRDEHGRLQAVPADLAAFRPSNDF